MKKSLLLLLLMMMFSPSSFAAEKLKFAAVEKVPPFTIEEDGKVTGVAIEIFKEVEKRMGFEADTIHALPFKRLWHYMVNGTLDGAIQIYYSKPREEFIVYSEVPGYWSAHYVFVKKGNEGKFPTNTLKDLYGKRVAKETGFFVTEEFNKAVQEGKIIVDEAQNTELNLSKLVSGRMDCYVSNYHVALYNIRKLGFHGQIVPLAEPLAPKKGTFMAISKNGKNIPNKEEFMKKFNATLKEIHTDGTLEKITDKYVR
jgi:polar amino acid transport system substrate-binding protein